MTPSTPLSFEQDTVLLTNHDIYDAELALSVLPQRHPLQTFADQIKNRVHRLAVYAAIASTTIAGKDIELRNLDATSGKAYCSGARQGIAVH